MLKPFVRSIVCMLICLASLPLSAIEPGERLDTAAIRKQATPVFERTAPKKPDFEIIAFFDVLSPDALAMLQMLDAIPDLFEDSGKTFSLTAVARNEQKAVRGATMKFRPEYLSVYAENEKKTIFLDFAKSEVLIPFAVVLQDGKVRWKGMPAELESVLLRMMDGTYSFQKQVRIELLRKDLQNAIQSGLPEVILRSSDLILAIAPADMIAIQSRLYVFQGRQRPDLAKSFLLDCVQKSPKNAAIRILALNLCIQTGDRDAFRENFKNALKDFSAFPASQARILAFTLENAPFGWIPLKEAAEAAQTACAFSEKTIGRRQAYLLEISARIAYLSMDLNKAIELQTRAAEYTDGNAQAVLDYYKSIRTLNSK